MASISQEVAERFYNPLAVGEAANVEVGGQSRPFDPLHVMSGLPPASGPPHLVAVSLGSATTRHLLVGECSNTGGCIDHGLLTDCDEADIRPVKIEDYEYHPTDQRAHDVDG